jgi:hypothetical protein
VIDLFGQDWLQDPNCVGSSVAAMGEEDPSSMSSWENWTREPPVEYVPRSLPEPVYVQNDYYDPRLMRGGVTFAQNVYVHPTAQNGEAVASVNSDDYMAARLLYAIREDERF